MEGRVTQHGVQHRNEGHLHGLDQLEHVLPVRSAEQSVLVLEHHRIRRFDGRDRPRKGGAVAGDPLGDNLPVCVGFGVVHYPDDYGTPTRLGSGDRRRKVAREGGQSAYGRRVGAHQRHCWRRHEHGGDEWSTRAGILGQRWRVTPVAARPALPLPCRGRHKGPRALRISATGTGARDACVAMIVSHCYVHAHLPLQFRSGRVPQSSGRMAPRERRCARDDGDQAPGALGT